MEYNANILLIDDNRDILELYSKKLLQEGFDVDSFDNVNSALKVFKVKKYDLIVLDLVIPGLDGKEEGG